LIEASQYKFALAHKNTCARCAARLANERALTEALQVTASAETEQAPAHTKAFLLKVFAATQHSPAPIISANKQADAGDRSVLAFVPKPRRHLSRWAWAAAAAVILALLSITALRLSHTASERQASGEQPKTDQPTIEHKDVEPQPLVPDKHQQAVSIPGAPKPKGKIARHHDIIAVGNHRHTKDNVNTQEVTTNFIPLTYVAEATAMESGQVVRVMVSRSSLIAMGLPMNVEHHDEMVKADVVVGDDGLARAIRFVYPSKK
jgi:hypothetical protein